MGYSKEAVTYVNNMFAQKRRKAQSDLLDKKAELYNAVPRLKEIEKLLAETGLKTVRCISGGNSDPKLAIAKLREENLSLQKERAEILAKLGLAPNYLDMTYECPLCNDEGFVDGKMCSCYQKELKLYTYNNINKGSHLTLCDFSKFKLDYYPDTEIQGTALSIRDKMKQNFDFCLSYANTFSEKSSNILMTGATGLGKTFLSLSIAKAAIDKGYGVVYTSAQNLLNSIEKEKFSNNSTETLDDIMECDLLIIDDLGSEFNTSFTVSTIYNIINTRINISKPVIISTNLSLIELQDTYSERVVSRFIGEYTILKFMGNDIRQIRKMEGRKVE